MKRIALLTLIALAGCATMASDTGTPGVKYGMSTQQVIGKIKSTEKLVETSDDKIVAIARWDVDQTIRRKVYVFSDGRLECIRYEYISGDSTTSNVNPIFCK